MATPTFYYSELIAEEPSVVLTASESAHAQKSRRLGIGQSIRLIDGLGRIAEGKISVTKRNAITAELHRVKFVERPQNKTIIATAIPKGDRQRNMIDMLTQIGVHTIIPLQCDHSVMRNNAKQIAKWQRIAIEACKQSQNPWLPEIHELLTVPQLLAWSSKLKQLQSCFADETGVLAADLVQGNNQTMMAIGPEGGFSKAEFRLFEKAKMRPVCLGNQILRTETAAICAAAQLISVQCHEP